jgi:hypothetical protein
MPRSFVSIDADLVPVREWLRANVGGSAQLRATDPNVSPPRIGPLFWAFEGRRRDGPRP